ncbi:MAG: hypothetical protein ACRD36_10075, partial [Candidatus Acidiferrum sp.]
MKQNNDWELSYLYGGSAIFSARNVAGAGRTVSRPLLYEAAKLAFGAQAEQAPRQRPNSTEEADWWHILVPPAPPRSAEADDAESHLHAFEMRVQQLQRRNQGAAMASVVSSAGLGFGPLANGTFDRLRIYAGGVLRFVRDDELAAYPYLAIRAARRAIATDPQNGHAYLLLAQAYLELNQVAPEQSANFPIAYFREIRRFQILAALTEAVRLSPDSQRAQQLLFDNFRERYPDLAAKHLSEWLRIVKTDQEQTQRPDIALAKKEFAERRGAELEQMTNDLKQRREQLTLQTAGNKPLFAKAQEAMKLGLVEDALKFLEEQIKSAKEGADAAAVGVSLENAILLFLSTGQVAEARALVQ